MDERLIVPAFESWLERWITDTESWRTPPPSDASVRAYLQKIDWRLVPWISTSNQIVRVRMDIPHAPGRPGGDTKGTLWIDDDALPFIRFTLDGRWPLESRPATGLRLIRYRDGKRWKTPRPIHEAQIAYYMLKYGR